MKALLVALTVLGGCGFGSVDVAIDRGFSADQRGEIERAVEAWNAWTARKIHVDDDAAWLVIPALSPEGSAGYTENTRYLIRVDPRLPNAHVYATALHEFGHVLGLQHTATGVMNRTRTVTTFNDDDVRECERAGACAVP
jgi:hypothetical protein